MSGGDEQSSMVGHALGEATGTAGKKEKKKKNDVSDRDVVVMGSGNLGLVYLMEERRRLTLEEMNERHPDLIPALRNHPHVGWLLVRSSEHGPVVLGGDGTHYLADGRIEGEDPLAAFSPNAPKHLLRTDGFTHVADIMIGSFYDPALESGCAFEELISFHGGIGGPQTRPFILHPSELAVPDGEIVGAAAVHEILARLEARAQRHRRRPSSSGDSRRAGYGHAHARSATPSPRDLVDLVREVIARYGRLGGSQFAAAISYRALFSLIPLATFVATILAQVLSAGGANRQDLVTAITDQLDLTPAGAARLDALIDAVPSPWSIAGLIALGLALWGATGVMSSMLKTLAVVFDEGVARSFVRGRLVSALLVLGALGLILCAVIVAMLENVVSKVSENVQEALGWQPFGFGLVFGVVVPLALSFAVFLLLYRYVPHHRPGWRRRNPRERRRRDRLPGGAGRSWLVPLGAGRLHQGLRLRERDLRVPLLGLPERERVRDLRDPHRRARRAAAAPALAGRRLAGNPARVAGVAERDPDDLRLLVEDLERPLHRRRRQAADAGVIRVVEEPEQEQHRADHHRDPTHHRRLDEGALAAVGEEQHEDEDDPGREEQARSRAAPGSRPRRRGCGRCGPIDGRSSGRAICRTPPARKRPSAPRSASP